MSENEIRADEREKIAAALDEEAETTPCAEDAVVVRDCARLVRAHFSYEDAERVADAEMTHQERVKAWTLECFGAEIASDKLERNDRFIEEALELTQATGYSAERAHALVDYVFGRAIGEPGQEVGGVMVTLAALCAAHGLDMDAEACREVDRITRPEVVAKIRAKQAAKPTGSALPVAAA